MRTAPFLCLVIFIFLFVILFLIVIRHSHGTDLRGKIHGKAQPRASGRGQPLALVLFRGAGAHWQQSGDAPCPLRRQLLGRVTVRLPLAACGHRVNTHIPNAPRQPAQDKSNKRGVLVCLQASLKHELRQANCQHKIHDAPLLRVCQHRHQMHARGYGNDRVLSSHRCLCGPTHLNQCVPAVFESPSNASVSMQGVLAVRERMRQEGKVAERVEAGRPHRHVPPLRVG